MKRIKPLVIALALAAGSFTAGSGCYGSTEVVATASVPGPELVWLGSGVWVVADWPYPVYYYDNFYWRNIDGYWYRSSWIDSGYVRVGIWPRTITRYYRPRRHIYYHAPDRRVRVAPRSHVRDRRSYIRDRRDRPRSYYRDRRSRPDYRDRRRRR